MNDSGSPKLGRVKLGVSLTLLAAAGLVLGVVGGRATTSSADPAPVSTEHDHAEHSHDGPEDPGPAREPDLPVTGKSTELASVTVGDSVVTLVAIRDCLEAHIPGVGSIGGCGNQSGHPFSGYLAVGDSMIRIVGGTAPSEAVAATYEMSDGTERTAAAVDGYWLDAVDVGPRIADGLVVVRTTAVDASGLVVSEVTAP